MHPPSEKPASPASGKGLKVKVSVEVNPEGGVSKQKLEEAKAALRELGLSDDITA